MPENTKVNGRTGTVITNHRNLNRVLTTTGNSCKKRTKDADASEHVDRQSRRGNERDESSKPHSGSRFKLERERRRSRSPRDRSYERKHRDHYHRRRDEERQQRSPRSPTTKDEGNSKKKRLICDELNESTSRRQAGPLPSQADSFSAIKDPSSLALTKGDDAIKEKQKPNMAPTGILAAATNTVATGDGTAIVLKYHEPPEARKPPAKDQWKLFVFKGADIVETIDLSTRSCWLIGREVAVVDMPAEHPSISKQHAVIQFRFVDKRNEYGEKIGKVKPYIIDLDSANGTKLNKEEIPDSRYLELRDKDLIQFGHSSREYVLMLPPKD